MEDKPGVQGPDKELHEEIIASQRMRASIWKWKLVLLSALGAVGLGISLGAAPNCGTPLVLCCIPVVCAYADLLLNHLSIRSQLIGAWKRTRPRSDDIKKYEDFCRKLGDAGVGHLEWWAVYSSSIAANLGLVIVGVGKLIYDFHGTSAVRLFPSSLTFGAVALSGLLGIGVTLTVRRAARSRHRLIERIETESRISNQELQPPTGATAKGLDSGNGNPSTLTAGAALSGDTKK